MAYIRYLILPFILLFFTNSAFMASPETPWRLERNEQNILVYSRNSPNSSFKEIKVETNFNAPLSVIVALLKDISAFPSWVYKCETAHVVKHQDHKEMIYYQKSDVPWPVSDRDMVVQSRFRQDPATKIVYFNSVAMPDILPLKADIVRIRKFKGSWTLTPIADGTVNVEYQIGIDPGGSLPAWMVNMASTEGPLITTQNLKKVVKQPKYQQARLTYIQELN